MGNETNSSKRLIRFNGVELASEPREYRPDEFYCRRCRCRYMAFQSILRRRYLLRCEKRGMQKGNRNVTIAFQRSMKFIGILK